jgi:hypothetical protein
LKLDVSNKAALLGGRICPTVGFWRVNNVYITSCVASKSGSTASSSYSAKLTKCKLSSPSDTSWIKSTGTAVAATKRKKENGFLLCFDVNPDYVPFSANNARMKIMFV